MNDHSQLATNALVAAKAFVFYIRKGKKVVQKVKGQGLQLRPNLLFWVFLRHRKALSDSGTMASYVSPKNRERTKKGNEIEGII